MSIVLFQTTTVYMQVTSFELSIMYKHNAVSALNETRVVGRPRVPKQTKESARRDGAAVARLLCGHMSLLCGAGPYVCIGWLCAWGSAICFYYAALGYMFLLVGCRRGAGPYVSIVRVYVYMCVCMYVYMYVYVYICVYVCMYVCVCVCVCTYVFIGSSRHSE